MSARGGGFWAGVAVGALLGGGGVFAALERPWRRGEVAVVAAVDAGPVAAGQRDGDRKARRRRRRASGGRGDGEPVDSPMIELTAADRRPVWRGDTVELPPRDVDLGAAGDERTLDQAEIDAGIATQSDRIVECITAARGDAELVATVELELLVDGGGRVTRSRVQAPLYLVNNGLAPCVRGAARAMRFAATGAPTIVRVPVDVR
jgi:hypothetical protein